jgi:hypothetical protein
MKLPPIVGTITEVHKIEPRRRGFNQVVIIHKEKHINDQGDTLSKEQHYVVQIYSNSKTDSRFVPESKMKEAIGAQCTAHVRLDAYRWENNQGGFEYSNRLNLEKWER